MKYAILLGFISLLFFSSALYTVSIEREKSPVFKKTRIEHEDGTSGARQALDFWTRSRAYPDADIPPDRYMKAFRQATTRMAKTTQPAADGGWRYMGPENVFGRTLSVAVNPKNSRTVYAGTASGGLWRSFTYGEGGHWNRISIGYPVLGVMAIGIDPADTNTIYIGTGEVYHHRGALMGVVIRTTRGNYGMGILKTTNGGTTWTKSLDWSANMERGVEGVTINPQNHNTILAATSEGIYRSFNSGATWTQVLAVQMAWDIVINPYDTTKILASCGNFASPGAGIYASTDGGTTWAISGVGLAAFSGIARLEPYQSIPEHVYAYLADSTTGGGGLYKTTNFGQSWTLIANSSIAGNQGWYSHYVAVHPIDETRMIIAGVKLTKSNDGGMTSIYDFNTHDDHHNFAHDPQNPDVIYEVDDGGVFRSPDFGTSWENAGGQIRSSQFYNGFSCSATDSNICLGQVQDNFGWAYNGTIDWVGGGVDEVGWTAISQHNDHIQYATDRNGNIWFSSDRGASFSITGNIPGYEKGITAWNTPFLLSNANNNVLYLGWDRIWRSNNEGASFFVVSGQLDGNPALSMAMSNTGYDTVYVGTAPTSVRAHLFCTTNGGTSWSDITGNTPDRYPLDLAVDPKNSAFVYAAFGGYGTGHLWKSTNTGADWTDITGTLPDVPTSAVMVDPYHSNIIYAGNDIGVYVSTDYGSTWQDYNTGLGEAVIVMDLQPCPANKTIRLATYGGGVYQRALYPQGATGVSEEKTAKPSSFSLLQNYPNPFNPETQLRIEIKEAVHVTLNIFDIAGKNVTTLIDGPKPPGTYNVSWNASGFPSGTYVATLTAGTLSQSRKMILLK